jgi:predicted RNase H-like HicB family nuclease
MPFVVGVVCGPGITDARTLTQCSRRQKGIIIMLTEYIEAAMKKAKWDILTDNSLYAEIPELAGVYARASHVESCVQELRAVLEEWIVLSITRRLPFPVIDGVALSIGATR